MGNIWERLETDTDKSFEAFCIYRDMGANRSLRKVCEKVYGKSTVNLRYIEEWSTTHNWQERVSAYDAYTAEKRRKRKEQERIRIEGNVLKDYHALRKAIDKRLKILADTDYKSDMGDLHSLLALMKTADDYARRVVGLPDKIAEQKTAISNADNRPFETRNTNVNLNAENAHDAESILKQLIELGAISSAGSETDNDPTPE